MFVDVPPSSLIVDYPKLTFLYDEISTDTGGETQQVCNVLYKVSSM